MAIGKLSEVVIDCRDCDRLADCSTTVSFQWVPEEKVVKNRVHLDVVVTDLDEAVDRCVALGATRISGRRGDSLGDFIVLCDPEGNEFCVVTT
jgi:hypothetical protein